MVSRWRAIISGDCAAGVEFHPPQTIRESEEYQVDLSDVSVLELVVPNKGNNILA